MPIEIGAYEAKTRLPALLRAAQAGQCYTITLRGVPVATLGPLQDNPGPDPVAAVAAMRQLAASAPTVAGDTLRALIVDGRD